MDQVTHHIRRATLDDLEVLRRLWRATNNPPQDFEKRLTEFQVAENGAGQIVACIAVQIEAHQGRIHSEAYLEENADAELRPQLFERVQILARNYGLFRLWTRDTHLFWRQKGFEEASEAVLSKLPPGFGSHEGVWLTLQLKEETAAGLSLDQEFDLFKQSQRELSDKAFRQARTLKAFAWVLLVLSLIGVGILGWYAMRHLPLPR